MAPTKSAAGGCCRSLAEASAEDYRLGTLVLASIADDSPTLDFPTGRSRFAAYKLGEDMRSEGVLETVTEYEGVWLPLASIFVPRFAFFDTALAPLGSAEPELFQSTGRLHRSGLIRREFYGACLVPVRTRYVVVHTDSSALGKRPVRLLSPGGMGASTYLERAQEAYQRLDKRQFAAGQVKQIPGSKSFATFQLPRKETGEIRFMMSE